MLWLRSVVFALALPGSVVGWMPLWLSTLDGGRFDADPLRWLGIAPLVAGAAALVWCIVDFARVGRGTLAPVDPPRFVVRSGLYRHVRNPMYVAVVVALLGEALTFGSTWLLGWAAVVALTVHTFVVLYEEPAMRRRFGAEYEAYRAVVPRWIPRRVAHPHAR